MMNRLANTVHNNVVGAAAEATGDVSAADDAAEDGEGAAAAAGDEAAAMVHDPITWRTPPSLLQRQLLVYDRRRDLLPLLAVWSRQSPAYRCGGLQGYDAAAIEAELERSLLGGVAPIVLQVREYNVRRRRRTAG